MFIEGNIVVLCFKFSVVMMALEKNLKEYGYSAHTIAGDFDQLPNYVNDTDLFILYLPEDILGDRFKQKKLVEVVDKLINFDCRFILIGEPRFHQQLVRDMPVLRSYRWFDRPIDTVTFGEAIEKILDAEDDYMDNAKSILIVDDDPIYAGMVKEMIKDKYDVYMAPTGMIAISFLLKTPVDLILLDYDMPVVNGPQVLQMLREEPSTKNIPVVFLTGVGTRDEVAKVMALKPAGYILKSTPREMLFKFLEDKLG